MKCVFKKCNGDIRIDVRDGKVDAFCQKCERWQGGNWADVLTLLLATVPNATFYDLEEFVTTKIFEVKNGSKEK